MHDRRNQNQRKSERKVQYCHYWNNFGNCTFESKNGRPCKFEHKSAPRCNFDGHFDRKFCMFAHNNQNMSFLANAPVNFQPNFRQGGRRQGQNYQINDQFPYQNQQGRGKRGANARQF